MQLFEIITGDETWTSFYEPEGVENKEDWLHGNNRDLQMLKVCEGFTHFLFLKPAA